MKRSDKILLSVIASLLVVIVGLNFIASHDTLISQSSSQASSLTGAVVGLQGVVSEPLATSAVVECWRSSTQGACQNLTGCFWNSGGNFCERKECWAADQTNLTYCETTLNQSYNLTCSWINNSGQEECFPTGGFFGDGCADFDGNQEACKNTFFCEWNSTGSQCKEPAGGFSGGMAGSPNPNCGVIAAQDVCINISGCSWADGLCSGNSAGIQCSKLNQSLCSTFTMLSTCCNWNGTACKTTFDNGCKNNLQAFPIGAVFCEDFKSFKNQTLCEQIAGAPWYMPCKWDNRTTECHFNGAGFGGGGAAFGELNTQVACEAQGGVWKSESFSQSGVTKTDTWCEFNFGKGGNCDSSCWACENPVQSGVNTTTQARHLCQNSSLGYCDFKADSYAMNGLGWCNPKQNFIEGGAKSCDDECSACDYLVNPDAQCEDSAKGCDFVNDTNADNGVGFCYGLSESYCGNDCFSCYSVADCQDGNGGDGACNWDGFNAYCKPVGFTGEICFNGVDDDNNQKADCADSACATDKFCGGADLSEQFGNCPSFTTNNTCTTSGCKWLKDDFEDAFGGASSGFCDFPGSQCWQHDGNANGCGNETGCAYVTSQDGFCSENETMFDTCFDARNQTACNTLGGCGGNGGGGFGGGSGGNGWCEPLIFSQCFGNETRRASQAACEANMTVGGAAVQICKWSQQSFNPSGMCEAVCWTTSSANCNNKTITGGLCQSISGLCDPVAFGGACFQADGNMSKCVGKLNSTCTYFNDTSAGNNVSTGAPSGWCDSKIDAGFVNFMGDQPPTILGLDPLDAGIPGSVDIREVGIRDDFDRYVFGSPVTNFSLAAACNGTPTKFAPEEFMNLAPGSGNKNTTFFWYLDSDGNTTNSCSSRDNSSNDGYEFSFKYQAKWSTSLTELKASYQCVNGSWGAVPIPLVSSSQKMCSLIGGPMAGVDKAELFKFKSLYNKSKDVRLYMTGGNSSTNDSVVLDSAGPYYYSQGSFDFKFENCDDQGGDADGDGLKASNDPDCINFLKFGFVPNEAGFQCGDDTDNDGDGQADCNDPGCTYDPYFCGGVLAPNANDKSSPKISWFKVDAFTDSAFVMYDTNEPANGTLAFYRNDSSCRTLNATIRDIGLMDSFVPDYKMSHDGGLDNYSFKTQKLGYP